MSIPSTENYFMGYEKGKVDGRIDAINQLIRIFEQRKAFYTQEEILNVLYHFRDLEKSKEQ